MPNHKAGKGMHKMPNGHMMSESEMKKMMGKKTASKKTASKKKKK